MIMLYIINPFREIINLFVIRSASSSWWFHFYLTCFPNMHREFKADYLTYIILYRIYVQGIKEV